MPLRTSVLKPGAVMRDFVRTGRNAGDPILAVILGSRLADRSGVQVLRGNLCFANRPALLILDNSQDGSVNRLCL